MAKKKEEIQEEKDEKIQENTSEQEAEAREKDVLLHQLEEKVSQLEETLAQTEDRLLRTLAEYDNFKKRSVREKDEIYFIAKSDVVKKLLPVIDNFQRAQTFTSSDDYAKGVEMILHQFFEILGTMEISEIAKVGEEFDPRFHEAVFREEKEGAEENTITEVLQQGYAIGEKVIRHAMVKVAG